MTASARSKAAARHAAARPDLAHQLGFFTRLWEIQDEFQTKAAPFTPASTEEATKALGHNQTLLSLAEVTVPLDAYRDAVRAVSALAAEVAGLPDEQVTALKETDLAEPITDEMLATALFGFDRFVRQLSEALSDERLGEALLAFILAESLTPFLTGAAQSAVAAVGKFDWLQWDSGLCPVCATPASSGVVRDEGELQGGRRWLSCPLCRTQWEYPRVRCARCGSRKHDDLEYLFDDEDPGHRIHLCKHCHGYTPISFEKELRAIAVPEVEEIVMVRLETAAAERGFTPLGDEAEGAAN